MIDKHPRGNGQLVAISVMVHQKRGNPCIELRRFIMEFDLMKVIISAAFHNQPLVILPTFKNLPASINSLLEKGIIYKKGDQYYYNI